MKASKKRLFASNSYVAKLSKLSLAMTTNVGRIGEEAELAFRQLVNRYSPIEN